MQDIFIGRQPIYNRGLDVVAYELLFRSGTENRAQFVDGDDATGQVLLNALVEIGLETLVGDRVAYINFTRRFLSGDAALPFDKEHVVLEILEDIEPDAELIQVLTRLKSEGYRLALDDFIYADKYRGLVALADTVKLDIRALGRDRLATQVRTLRGQGTAQLLAEKVETLDEFEYCKELGFDLFQGYFLSRPRVMRGRAIPNNRIAALQLLAKLQDPDVGFEELEAIIGRDLSLSYKLLHYINSASLGLRKKIESIRQAITMIGLHRLRMMVTLITLSSVSSKPPAVMATALTRAKMCEFLARELKRADADSFYLVGLFSTLDVLMDNSLDEVLKSLPLADDVKEALLHFEGAMGEVIRCVLAVERAEWESVRCLGLTRGQVNDAYLQAIAAARGDCAAIEQIQGTARSVA